MTEFFNATTFSHSILKSKFGGWLNFIVQADDTIKAERAKLNENEKKTINNEHFKLFFSIIEKTDMTKSYKMPVILSFLKNDSIKLSQFIIDITSFFINFYKSNKVFMKDIVTNSAIKNIDDIKEVAANCESNPIKALTCGAEADYFEYDKTQKIMKLKFSELQNIGKTGVDLIKELLNYRVNDYFKRKYCDEKNIGSKHMPDNRAK